MRVAIINYGMGNLDSVARAVQECGGDPVVTDQACDLEAATHIILPGVGAFALGMKNIHSLGIDAVLAEQVLERQIPFLGLCLGMQLLAERGYEPEESAGLGWINAEVRRLEPNGSADRVPHVGWNDVELLRDAPLFRGVASGTDFYFVHSYHVVCRDPADVVGRTPYCGTFVSAIGRRNIWGVQFHPEKSQRPGFHVLRNFLAL
jgi:imidazole glycerol-phosphate synthase subunit HisH